MRGRIFTGSSKVTAVLSSPEYRDFVAGLKSRIQAARASAARTVNSELILLYWHIGQGIVEKQQTLGWDCLWIEELVEIAEKSASAPIYSLLKRTDESTRTSLGYDQIQRKAGGLPHKSQA